jgi:hypothetical protein
LPDRNEQHRRAKHLLRSGWAANDWRRIDGGTDYWMPSVDEDDMVNPFRRVDPEVLSRRIGTEPLWFAKQMMADGYDEEHVSKRTGWGAWWLR